MYLYNDNMENIVDTYQISTKSIDDTYRIGSVKRYRALPATDEKMHLITAKVLHKFMRDQEYLQTI